MKGKCPAHFASPFDRLPASFCERIVLSRCISQKSSTSWRGTRNLNSNSGLILSCTFNITTCQFVFSLTRNPAEWFNVSVIRHNHQESTVLCAIGGHMVITTRVRMSTKEEKRIVCPRKRLRRVYRLSVINHYELLIVYSNLIRVH